MGLHYFGVQPRWPFDYEPVAQVLEIDLEEVFRLTQGIELSRDDEVRVEWLDLLRPNRSTSIGDVVVVDNGNVVQTWRCTGDCWELLSPDLDG